MSERLWIAIEILEQLAPEFSGALRETVLDTRARLQGERERRLRAALETLLPKVPPAGLSRGE